MKNQLLALAGAVVGGLLGHFAFMLLLKQGLYALILPGGLVGLGAGIVKTRSLWVAIVCGVLALAAGLVSDWRYEQWVVDPSFWYFLTHVYQLKAITLLMLAAGAFLGFWVPFRRRQDAAKAL